MRWRASPCVATALSSRRGGVTAISSGVAGRRESATGASEEGWRAPKVQGRLGRLETAAEQHNAAVCSPGQRDGAPRSSGRREDNGVGVA